MRRRKAPIVPIILAFDDDEGFSRGLAIFGGETTLQIALDNSAGLSPAVIVADPATLKRLESANPFESVRSVVLASSRGGQIRSLRKGLKVVPKSAAFMLYPVDYPLLEPGVIERLAHAFRTRLPRHLIVAPRFRGRAGHPVIFAPEIREELMTAATARDVVYRLPNRVKWVAVRTASIWQDFDSEATYRRRLREYLRKR